MQAPQFFRFIDFHPRRRQALEHQIQGAAAFDADHRVAGRIEVVDIDFFDNIVGPLGVLRGWRHAEFGIARCRDRFNARTVMIAGIDQFQQLSGMQAGNLDLQCAVGQLQKGSDFSHRAHAMKIFQRRLVLIGRQLRDREDPLVALG